MADQNLVCALERFYSAEEIKCFYKEAFQAYQERSVEVVITSSSMEGGSASGELRGDPQDLMEACEYVLQKMEAAESGNLVVDSSNTIADFSGRVVGT